VTWLMTGLLGLGLGLCLYGLVCARNACLPWARQRFGSPGYWACWVFSLGLMLVAANTGFAAVRLYFAMAGEGINQLTLEIEFLTIALLSGGALALRRARNCCSANSANSPS
jgi:hypothetical protein